MRSPPWLKALNGQLKVSFQSTQTPQELHVRMRLAGAQDTTLAQWGLDWGYIGGGEFAPWDTSWELDLERSQPPWNVPIRDGLKDVLYVARVTGMSHRYIPHLVARLALNTEFVFGKPSPPPAFLEVMGSAPITDPSTSVTEAQLGPMLADTAHPGLWPDLGFPVEHVASKQHELGVQIQLVAPMGAAIERALQSRLLQFASLCESFPGEGGKAVDLARAQRKRFPPLLKNVMAQGYSAEVLHTHRPCCALLLNLLAKFHRTVAPIACVRLTSRLTAPPKGSVEAKENWFTWQLKGTLLGGEAEAPPEPKPRKPRPARAANPPKAPAPEPATSKAKLAEPLTDGGLLAGDAMGPTLYGVLRAELHLAPVTDDDAEGLRKAVARLGEALASELKFSVNWNENSSSPRVVRFQPKHLEHIPASLTVLTGSRYGDKLARMMMMGEYHSVVDVSFKGAGEGPDPSKTASPWSLTFRSEIQGEIVEGAFVAPAVLRFSVPDSFPLDELEALVRDVAACLRVRWGNAGYGYATWPYFNGGAPSLRDHALKHLGFDRGVHHDHLGRLDGRLRSVNWLTLVGDELWDALPDAQQKAIENAFPPESLGDTRLLRATPLPEKGKGGPPTRYAELDGLLRSIRLEGGIEPRPCYPAAGLPYTGPMRWEEESFTRWLRRLEP